MRAQRSEGVTAAKRPEDERLPIGASFAYGLQHVLTMYGGIIAVPIIIGGAAGVSAAEIALLIASGLFIGGLATILQAWGLPFFGSQLPLVQGVSFAGVATMLAILDGGGAITDVFGAVLVAGAIGLVIAPFFAQIVRFFPPVVTGVVITTIGLSLMPTAADWAMGGAAAEGTADYGSMANLALAGGTLVLLLLLSKVGVAAISRLSILLAIVIGTIVAGVIGMADFSGVFGGEVIAIPTPLAFGAPTFSAGAIVSMFIVVIVIMTETTADILAVGEIVGAKVDRRRIANGLRADMLSTTIAPIFNSFSQSAFAQNVGLVAISGVRSRFVVVAGGAIMVLLGIFPVVGELVAAIPSPVLGGAGIVLFGSVAAAGIRTLAKVRYEGNMNLIIVATSLAFGLVPVVQGDLYDAFPSWFQVIFGSGISSAAIMAVALNILFNHLNRGTPEDGSVFVASGARLIKADDLALLQEGDTIIDGKVVDSDGAEVPVVDGEKFDEVKDKLDKGEITSQDELKRICEEI